MSEGIQRVAFIGLGRMGSGMARNILKAGFKLTVYNRTAEKIQPFAEAGAVSAGSPKEAATGVDVVVTCIMDDQSVLGTVTGDQGILAGLKPEAVHIGTSTISPHCATHLAALHTAHGSHYVAAPVVGGPDVAEAGRLITFVAGHPVVIAKCRHLFDAYAQDVIHVGDAPAIANSLKLTFNYMLMSVVDLMGQVYVFGEKSGIAPQHLAMLLARMFNHPVLQEYATRTHTRNFDEVGFDLPSALKDVQLILQASTDTRVILPYASLIREKLLTAIANGMEGKDWSAIYEVARMNAGLK